MTGIIDRNLVAYQSAESFESSLINQKGFVSYYFLDGRSGLAQATGKIPARYLMSSSIPLNCWLKMSNKNKPWIKSTGNTNFTSTTKTALSPTIRPGSGNKAPNYTRKCAIVFFNILELCERYKDFHTQKIMSARNKSLLQARKLRFIAGVAIFVVFSLSVLLAFILAKHILDPLHRLAQEANKEGTLKKSGDEVKAISRSVHDLDRSSRPDPHRARAQP